MVFLGSRDEVAHLGYVLGRCPKCGTQGVMTVFQTKRKITVSVVASLPVGEQRVIECRSCGARFALPREMQAELEQRLISADQLADYVGRLPYDPTDPKANTNGQPAVATLYQMLQVDPYADPDVIEAAFKRLAFKYHPDRSKEPDAAERMRELIAARDILADPTHRRAYDDSIGIKPKEPKVVRPPVLRPEDI